MGAVQKIEFSQRAQNTLERIAKSMEDLVRLEKKRSPNIDFHQHVQPVKMDEEQKDEGEKLTHDDQTLFKVHEALKQAGIFQHAARLDIVSQLQNAGILFRERAN